MDKGERLVSPVVFGLLGLVREEPGRELRDRVELWLAWQRVAREVREELRSPSGEAVQPEPPLGPSLVLTTEPESPSTTQPVPHEERLRLVGTVPPEAWNRIGIKLLPKMRSGNDLTAHIELTMTIGSERARSMEAELRQILEAMGLTCSVRLESL